MGQNQTTKPSWQRRQSRIFSEDFKKQKVKEIESKLTTVVKVSRLYQVSRAAVYQWLDKYSIYNKLQVRLIVEPMSDSKKIEELQKRIRDLERMLGQKQIQIEFQDKQMELAEQMFGIEIKKKLGLMPLDGLEKTADGKEEK